MNHVPSTSTSLDKAVFRTGKLDVKRKGTLKVDAKAHYRQSHSMGQRQSTGHSNSTGCCHSRRISHSTRVSHSIEFSYRHSTITSTNTATVFCTYAVLTYRTSTVLANTQAEVLSYTYVYQYLHTSNMTVAKLQNHTARKYERYKPSPGK